MTAADSTPLLSICIPTYNRSGFLKVMLGALLPQTEALGDQVEVWVLDNCSTDDTPAVLDSYRSYRALQTIRHSSNTGPIKNIFYGPTNLAKGIYSWVLGDHNLMRPNMLSHVLHQLQQSHKPILHYTNFRCANYPDHWPTEAIGGYDGPFHYLADQTLEDAVLPTWSMLLKPETSIATQSYAHIVPTEIWRDFWKNREIGEDYSDAITTYPHTTMLVLSSLDSKVATIKEPTITIFNNAQWWNNPETKWKVYLYGLPNLLQILEEKGTPANLTQILRQRFERQNLEQTIQQMINTTSRVQVLGRAFSERHLSLRIRTFILRYAALMPIQNALFSPLSGFAHYCLSICQHSFRKCKTAAKKLLRFLN